MQLSLLKTAEYFIQRIKDSTCAFCKNAGYIQKNSFCCNDCEDKAFVADAKSFIDGDLNDAKCVGKEKSPVGSPRQRSFCARMCGHKKKNTGKDTKSDPDSCVNQALRRWKCRCS